MGENKHSPHDLAQMQGLPLEAKIIMSQRRIRDWYDYLGGDIYVSFSGGKDIAASGSMNPEQAAYTQAKYGKCLCGACATAIAQGAQQ